MLVFKLQLSLEIFFLNGHVSELHKRIEHAVAEETQPP